MINKSFQQIALRANSVSDRDELISGYCEIGHKEWIFDNPIINGLTFKPWKSSPEKVELQAFLAFNYTILPGIEFEIITFDKILETYIYGANRVRGAKLAHMAFHVDSLPPIEAVRDNIVHSFVTVQHTNPEVPKNRRYRYMILDTIREIGTYTKLIERLTLDETPQSGNPKM